MISPDIFAAKLFKKSLVNNFEQTTTSKLGLPFVAKKESFKSTVFDKTTNTLRKEQTLIISTIKKLDFNVSDIVEIKGDKWVIDYIEEPDPFKPLEKSYKLTLKR
jgi:hypothetical protein